MSGYQDGDAFRHMFAESLPGSRVKLYVRVVCE